MYDNTLDAPEYTIDVPVTAHYERFVAAQRPATYEHSQFIHIHQITIPTCPKSFSHTRSLLATWERSMDSKSWKFETRYAFLPPG